MDRGKAEEHAGIVVLQLVRAADVGESTAEVSGVEAREPEQPEVLEVFPVAEYLGLKKPDHVAEPPGPKELPRLPQASALHAGAALPAGSKGKPAGAAAEILQR